MTTEQKKIESYGKLVMSGMAEVCKGEEMLAASNIVGWPSYETTIATADGEEWKIIIERPGASEA